MSGDRKSEANALVERGSLLAEQGRLEESLHWFANAARIDPGSLSAHNNLAVVLQHLGRLGEAETAYDRALVAAPDNVPIQMNLVVLKASLGRFTEALADCERVLRASPSHPKALHIKALALQNLGRSVEALKAFMAAENATGADRASVIVDHAWLLAELGRKQEAVAAYDEAIRLRPDLAIAWYRRSYLSRDGLNLAAMEALADDPARPQGDRMNLMFALGKAHLDAGEGEGAFARFGEANRIKRSTLRYDIEAEEQRFAEIVATFSKEAIARGSGEPSGRPIFVFGMPRSGTSLLEQILASHPEVHGAGELVFLGEIAETPGLLRGLPRFTPEQLAAFGRRYQERVEAVRPGAGRIIDKMPYNFLYAGLIPLILPGARMIHCRRDPLDTCLSCYSLHFTSGHEYTYDLTELGRFYRLYQRLMAHWRQVLPAGAMLEVDYEQVVSDTETEVRRILDFCGLPWDERCLRFHETARSVSTASLDQVRKPVYSASVGRAQKFKPWLGELAECLGMG